MAQGPIHNSTARLGVLLCFVFPFLKVCVRKVSKMAPEAIAKKNAMVNRKRNNFKRNGEAFDLGKQKKLWEGDESLEPRRQNVVPRLAKQRSVKKQSIHPCTQFRPPETL